MDIINYKRENKDTIRFTVQNINLSLINGLRRIAYSEIPYVAFNNDPSDQSDIDIIKNTSTLHNEFLQHRIGLIPIHIDYEDVESFDKDRYIFSIDIKNESDEIINVTSEHFKIFDSKTDSFLEDNDVKKIFPPNEITGEYILINKLKPDITDNNNGEELKFTAKASVNIGKVNSRWCVVSESSFTNLIDPIVAESKLQEKIKENNLVDQEEINEFTKAFYNYEAHRYFEKDKLDNPISFNVCLESIGTIDPIKIYLLTLKILSNKLDSFIENINNESNLEIKKSDTYLEGFDISIKDESDTLCNIIQTYMYNLFIDKEIQYSGYKIPHPLINESIIRIGLLEDSNNIDKLKELLTVCIKQIKNDIDEYRVLFEEIAH